MKFPKTHGRFTMTEHFSGLKWFPNIFKNIKIIQSAFSDNNRTKLKRIHSYFWNPKYVEIKQCTSKWLMDHRLKYRRNKI